MVLAELRALVGLVVPLPEEEGAADYLLDGVVAPDIAVQGVGGKDLGLLDVHEDPLALLLGLLDHLVVRVGLVVLRGGKELVDGLASFLRQVGLAGPRARAVLAAVESHPPVHRGRVGLDGLLHPRPLLLGVDDLVLEGLDGRADLLLRLQRPGVDPRGRGRRSNLGRHVAIDDPWAGRRRRGCSASAAGSAAHFEEEADSLLQVPAGHLQVAPRLIGATTRH
mmetsp:Transcript_95985/g.277197  ORF Transcript_95985/g.277197 Transcript_95985/m.277197 type:complete len:223 (-) Transcript_95985:133-801(-)